jgi:hypothetical protein
VRSWTGVVDGVIRQAALDVWGRRERVDDGRRKDGGSRPQLRGALGGMAVVALGIDG